VYSTYNARQTNVNSDSVVCQYGILLSPTTFPMRRHAPSDIRQQGTLQGIRNICRYIYTNTTNTRIQPNLTYRTNLMMRIHIAPQVRMAFQYLYVSSCMHTFLGLGAQGLGGQGFRALGFMVLGLKVLGLMVLGLRVWVFGG
jgi:hypothetical protein